MVATLKSGQSRNSTLEQGQRAHVAGRMGEAEQAYQSVLNGDPNCAEAWHLLGVLLGQSGKTNQAIDCINKALSLDPRKPQWLYNLGCVFQQIGAVHDAILAFTRSVGLDRRNAQAWNNLGNLFATTHNYDAARKALERGISADPRYLALHDNLCRVHKRENNFGACLKAADRGLESNPESVLLWIHRAEACFALGEFDSAWAAYEWRFRSTENPNQPPDYPIEVWQGQSLAGKSILIWTEQGPGETFLFSSMLNELLDAADRCIVVTTDRLLPSLQRSFPQANVVDGTQLTVTRDTADFQCSLISAGRWLRRSWSDFPRRAGHICPDSKRQQEVHKSLQSAADNKPLVGIAWRSFGSVTGQKKSIALDAWRPILSVPGIRFISLQYGDVAQDIANLKAATGVEILPGPVDDPVSDLEGHLALVSGMDLVISSSNTTVHAAAALGVPVWCAVAHTLGEGLRWPWFTDRQDSPWYETVKLYRQEVIDDWTLTIADMAIDLAKWHGVRDPNFNVESHLVALAAAYRNIKQPKACARAAKAAVAENPASHSARRLAAQGLIALGECDDAITHLTPLIEQETDSINSLVDRAMAFQKSGRLEEAESDLRHALKLEPSSLEGLNNLGNVKIAEGFSREALDLHRQGSTLAPENKTLKLSIANRVSELQGSAASQPLFEALLHDEEMGSIAACDYGISLLKHGPSREGWILFRHRLSKPEANIRYDNFPFPVWSGESVAGKRVLVWTEQGLGEEILVATLMRDLAKQAKSVTLLCSNRVLAIFRKSLHGITVVQREEPLPKEAVDPRIDVQMSLSDVGALLRPTSQSFAPSLKAPTLKANKSKTAALKRAYSASNPHLPLIGLSWHSSAPATGGAKSIAPELYAKLIQDVPAQFVSLQHEPPPEHLSTLEAAAPERWIYDQSVNPMAELTDFAAQIAALDFVVTISNTTAHIAGALGIPTAMFAPPYAGRLWYWFKGTEQTLWYPTVTIYDGDEALNWGAALDQVIDRLKQHFGQK